MYPSVLSENKKENIQQKTPTLTESGSNSYRRAAQCREDSEEGHVPLHIRGKEEDSVNIKSRRNASLDSDYKSWTEYDIECVYWGWEN